MRVTSEPDILLLTEDLQRLVEGAEERGNVRQSELNEVLEPLQLDPLETDSVYRELERRTIEIVADLLDDGDAAPVNLPAPAPIPLSWETTTDALQLFLREAGQHPLLSAAQEVELAKAIERGDVRAEQRMIQSPAARRLDREYSPQSGPAVPRLIQEGTLGLIRAVEKFAGAAVTSSPPTPRGGSARPSPARSPTRRGSSGCRCTSSSGCTS